MSPLLAEALLAHGSLLCWKQFGSLSATIVTGGAFWGLEGLVQDTRPRRITVDLRRERCLIEPLGHAGWHGEFTPDRVAIVDQEGETVAVRYDPRSAFDDHALTARWDLLHRAYFSGYALWTYLNTPFLLAEPDFLFAELPPLQEQGEEWRGLRAIFPVRIATHSRRQDFYFGPDGLLRRHDYHVDVAGGFAAVHLVSDFVEVDGLRFPTKRRAYRRDDRLRPLLGNPMLSIDLSAFALGQD
jgi:hypothetical protein